METNRDGHVFEVVQAHYDGADFWHKFKNGTWEPRSFDILNRYLRPDLAFVDIGAWIGPLTLYASRRCRHVYAVEPDTVALKMLRPNVENNCDNVTIDTRAISADGKDVLLSSERALGHSNTNTVGYGTSKGVIVPTVTMESFFNEYIIRNVGLLKMDIEGGEFTILPSCIKFLADQDIPILLGLHGPNIQDPQHHLDELYKAIADNYQNVYDVYNFDAPLAEINGARYRDVLITNEVLHNVDIETN